LDAVAQPVKKIAATSANAVSISRVMVFAFEFGARFPIDSLALEVCLVVAFMCVWVRFSGCSSAFPGSGHCHGLQLANQLCRQPITSRRSGLSLLDRAFSFPSGTLPEYYRCV